MNGAVVDGAAICSDELSRLRSARMLVAELHPFWGHLLLHVRLIVAAELPTFAATDCLRSVWFNPNLTRHLDPAQLRFVLCHEVGHQLFESTARRDDRDLTLWNQATDYAINRIVFAAAALEPEELRMRSPNGTYPGLGEVQILHDPAFDGLTAEAIYERLWRRRWPLSADEPAADVTQVQLPGAQVEVRGVHGGGVDIHLPCDLDGVELRELSDRIIGAIAAYERAQLTTPDPGHAPLADVRSPPRGGASVVPWQRTLRRYASECLGRVQYTRSRPKRRLLLDEVIVAGLHREGLGELVISIDTSGSMDERQLTRAFVELSQLAHLVPDVTVLVADAALHTVVATAQLPAFLRERRLIGGGGTDHRPVFEWLAQRPQPPELFLGMTDLHSRFPAQPPPCPVLWLVPADHGDPPWGDVLVMPDSSRDKNCR